jgi:hypothetical protein
MLATPFTTWVKVTVSCEHRHMPLTDEPTAAELGDE